MELITYPDRDMLAMDLARKLAGALRLALARRDRASFAVPGGTTPGPVFDLLSGLDLEWERVDVIPGDERWLPPSDPRSNGKLIRERLLRDKASAARLVPLWSDFEAPEAGVDAAIARVEPLLPLDLALVGMGEDGHFASIFPGADWFEAAIAPEAQPVLPINSEAAPEPRITLTLPVFRKAFELHMLITGAEKRRLIEDAKHRDPRDFPAALLLDQLVVHWAE